MESVGKANDVSVESGGLGSRALPEVDSSPYVEILLLRVMNGASSVDGLTGVSFLGNEALRTLTKTALIELFGRDSCGDECQKFEHYSF